MTRRAFNWDRPKYRLRGKQTESLHGSVPTDALTGGRPRPRQPSKAEMRAESARLIAEYERRKAERSGK